MCAAVALQGADLDEKQHSETFDSTQLWGFFVCLFLNNQAVKCSRDVRGTISEKKWSNMVERSQLILRGWQREAVAGAAVGRLC